MTVATIETSCQSCGAPLTEAGVVDLGRLPAFESDVVRRRALLEERASGEDRLALLRDRQRAAEARKDDDDRIMSERRIENIENALQANAEILEELGDYAPPSTGACEGCGVVFRGGRVDRLALASASRERERKRSQLAALEDELAGVELRIALEAQNAAEADSDGLPHAGLRAQEHRDKAETLTARKELIEQTIISSRAALGNAVAKSRARAR